MAQSLQELAVKAVKEVKDNLKKMLESKKKGIFYKALPNGHTLNSATVKKAAAKKAEIDILLSKVAALEEEYKPLREEILASLNVNLKDKVEVLIDGIHVKKHVQVKGSGKLDETKFMELARQKKLLSKVTKKVRVVDEDLVLLQLAAGTLTYEEYIECVSEGNVIQQLKLERKFCPEVVPNADEDQEAI